MRFKRRKLEISPPYVSMADIAFNLVLFFLILAKTQDDGLKWEPVRAADLKQAPTARITITITADKDNEEGKIYLNGTEIGRSALAGAIEALLESDPTGNRTVLLKIHKDTQASKFEPVLGAVSEAGCEIVHVLEEEP